VTVEKDSLVVDRLKKDGEKKVEEVVVVLNVGAKVGWVKKREVPFGVCESKEG